MAPLIGNDMTRLLTVLVCVCASILLFGCPPKSTENSQVRNTRPDATAIIESHNLNASRLKQIDATGVLQIRWVQSNGRTREEQGEAHLWIDQPRKTALRVSKLGEDLFWIGSDQERFWLFDLLDDDNTSLITHPHGTSLVWGDGADAIELQPLALLDLMGVTELRQTDGEPTYSDTDQCWLIPVSGAAGPLLIAWDPTTRIVRGLKLLDQDGDVRMTSSLRRRASVDIFDGVAFERPQMATLIDFEVPDGRGRLKLALEQDVFGDLGDQPVDRLFNLDVLRRRFRPDNVQGDADGSP